MKMWIVSFWYNTDERCERQVKAYTAVEALVLATQEDDLIGWCNNGPEFSVKIKHKYL